MRHANRFHCLSQPFQRSSLLIVVALSVILLGACARQQGSTSETTSSVYAIELLPPQPGASSLSVRLTDGDGQPVTDAQVSLEGNMNHAGMVPVLSDPVSDDADGTADGVYVVPFKFTMFGDWIVTVSADIDGETATHDFDLSVDAEGAELTGS
jgi:hypothetical protein